MPRGGRRGREGGGRRADGKVGGYDVIAISVGEIGGRIEGIVGVPATEAISTKKQWWDETLRERHSIGI